MYIVQNHSKNSIVYILLRENAVNAWNDYDYDYVSDYTSDRDLEAATASTARISAKTFPK